MKIVKNHAGNTKNIKPIQFSIYNKMNIMLIININIVHLHTTLGKKMHISNKLQFILYT